jgi:cob(I)alamin adenosyltransferase
MKIYTGTGDKGKTSLFSGERVTKADPRIDAYGDLDELNSILGALAAHLSAEKKEKTLAAELQQIQSDLLHAGAWLATHPNSAAVESLEELPQDRISFLEKAIDRLDRDLPALRGFILPGGHITAAWAHVARTVCRRSERKLVPLIKPTLKGKVAQQYRNLLIFLNRLSDYLFVLARHCNQIQGVSDKLWKP